MSFSSDAKAELCRVPLTRRCCARAEAYGVLLYAGSFSPTEVRIVTESEDFAARLPKLFQKAFSVRFDAQESGSKSIFRITDGQKLAVILEALGYDPDQHYALHVNFALLEEECCRASFLRGAFLAGGSVTDPLKRYHLELATPHLQAGREGEALLRDMGYEPKNVQRQGNGVTYFKQSDHIEELLTRIGAPAAAMEVMAAKVEKEMRNTVTRQINCDSHNADKTVAAAQEQMNAIRRIAKDYGLDALPEPLKDAALLRIANPEASLADLATLSYPPVTKSCLNHRFKKIMGFKPEKE